MQTDPPPVPDAEALAAGAECVAAADAYAAKLGVPLVPAPVQYVYEVRSNVPLSAIVGPWQTIMVSPSGPFAGLTVRDQVQTASAYVPNSGRTATVELELIERKTP